MNIFQRYPHLLGDKRIILTFYLTIIGLAFLLVTGLVSLYNENKLVSSILFSTMLFAVANLYILTTRYFDFARIGLAIIAGFIACSLLASGGQEQTGLLWTYPIVTIVIAVLSVRESLIFSTVYLLIVVTIFGISNDTQWLQNYEQMTAKRYLVSMMALISIATVMIYIQESAFAQLAKQNVTDNLTGVYNRAILDHARLRELESVPERSPSFLILLDIDFFKKINDNFGHNVGDKVLIVLGDILTSAVRSSDLAIRWGGEEFLIVLKSCPEQKTLQIAKQIKDQFESNTMIQELLGKPATLSMGVTELVIEDDFDKNVEVADSRLYYAKQNGRNQIVYQDMKQGKAIMHNG
jgi:diguanylate cyclase (GGDEF)-like protein